MSDDLFKDYTPKIIEYDTDIDDGSEHAIREARLNLKKNLLEKIRKAKANVKGNKTTFRKPIRTEDEK